MLIQTVDSEIGITVSWIEPDLLELNITEYTGGEQHNLSTRYIAPAALISLADYINDTLCR